MKVLDLFCGAGGAAMGLHRAWPDAEIVGVDIKPQRHYPFTFVQADAMTYPLEGFDFIWASPPCQAFTAMKTTWNAKPDGYHPKLIGPTRERLRSSDSMWVIENVGGAFGEMGPCPLMLCGSMFGLGLPGFQLRRHRYFDSNWVGLPWLNPRCSHKGP